MSTLEAKSPWLIRVVDWANPILVKELRQSLKSKQFVVTFMLLVTVAWLVSVFGLLMVPNQVQYGPAGRYFFIGFYMALAVAALLIVPFGSFRSLQSERDFNTFEILSVTTITPQQIVRGRLLSSLVQCFIYYSAITPFIAFASTMQGFDSLKAAYVLVVTMLMSMMLSMAALMISTLSKQRATQGLFTLILIAPLVGTVIIAGNMILFFFAVGMPITTSVFWQLNAVGLLAAASYFVLFQQIATANLTFESANHSTGIRITAMVQFLALWLIAFGYLWWNKERAHPQMFYAFAFISIFHWAAFGLAFTAELDSLSRRIRREFPKKRFVRVLIAPFLPGGSRAYLFLLVQSFLVWVFYVVGMSYFARGGWSRGSLRENVEYGLQSPNGELRVVTLLCLMLVIYMGVNTALARWGQAVSELVKPAHARVITFLILMAAMVGPQLLYISKVIELSQGHYHPLQILDPVSTALYLQRNANRTSNIILMVLCGMALFAILANSLGMIAGIRHVYYSRVRPRKPADIKPFYGE